MPTLTIDVLANADGAAWARVDWPAGPVGVVLDVSSGYSRAVISAASSAMPVVSVYRTGAGISSELGCRVND